MAKYYDNIAKCPMSVYMDCDCDKNLKALVYEGNADDVEDFVLASAWMEIQEQFADKIGDAETRTYLQLVKEVNAERATLTQVNGILEAMNNIGYHPWFGEELNRLMKTSFVFRPHDLNDYTATLKRAFARIPGMEMSVELKEIRMQAIEEKMEARLSGAGKKSSSREYYAQWFNAIEEHYGVAVTEQITVLRYIDKVVRLVKESQKSKPVKNGRSKR